MAAQVAVVGAGAAGTLAALVAARHGARVTVYDTNAQVGRKLLITGNGRCNLSNAQTAPACYACADPQALALALERFGVAPTLTLFSELGIPVYSTPDGWYYPLSESAAGVTDILAARLRELQVELRLQTKVADLRPVGAGWELALGGPDKWVRTERVIVACGGAAYPALGSKGELFPVLARLGHTVIPPRPALAPLTADVRRLHRLQGVRLDVAASLWDEDRELGATIGNLMFTQYGFSGPAAMDLAHLVNRHTGKELTLLIDLLADRREPLLALLAARPEQALTLALDAVMAPRLALVLPELGGLPTDIASGDLDVAAIERLLRLRVRVTGTRDLKEAQLSSGGVALTEVQPETMASRLLPGLHLCGEVLDVVGPCGGYNLQWAWTSGVLAGAAAAQRYWT
jgi:hypothetical protein